jgi:hypothetical protein
MNKLKFRSCRDYKGTVKMQYNSVEYLAVICFRYTFATPNNLNTQVDYNALIMQTEVYCMQSVSAVQYVYYDLKWTSCFCSVASELLGHPRSISLRN